MKPEYDYLIVGSGLYGATFAWCATRAGKRCLVVERRRHTGGNLRCENVEDIVVHRYGAHIFHTSDREVWDMVNSIVPFRGFINSPMARYGDELYNLPFNMNTFCRMWGSTSPAEAQDILTRGESGHISDYFRKSGYAKAAVSDMHETQPLYTVYSGGEENELQE